MKRTNNQLYHFILSFPEVVLREWYNTCVIDPYGDHAYQTIRDNTEEQEDEIKSLLTLDTLCKIGRNEKTDYTDLHMFFAVMGGDNPYIISFNYFEEFLKKMDNLDAFLQFVQENPEQLENLIEIAER